MLLPSLNGYLTLTSAFTSQDPWSPTVTVTVPAEQNPTEAASVTPTPTAHPSASWSPTVCHYPSRTGLQPSPAYIVSSLEF